MYLNITWLPQKPYLFTNGEKMVNSSKFDTFLMADGSWLMMLTTWRQDPGNCQMTVHTLARIPSRAESTEASADVSQKHEYSKSSWGVWKQSNSIFCTGWTSIYMKWCSLSGPIWKLKWRHIFQQELWVPDFHLGPQPPQHWNNLSGSFIWKTWQALCPSHPWLLPKMPVRHHLSPHTFILCAFFVPVATLILQPSLNLFFYISQYSQLLLETLLLRHALTEVWLLHRHAAARSVSTPQLYNRITPGTSSSYCAPEHQHLSLLLLTLTH